jgi:hypothetical protein
MNVPSLIVQLIMVLFDTVSFRVTLLQGLQELVTRITGSGGFGIIQVSFNIIFVAASALQLFFDNAVTETGKLPAALYTCVTNEPVVVSVLPSPKFQMYFIAGSIEKFGNAVKLKGFGGLQSLTGFGDMETEGLAISIVSGFEICAVQPLMIEVSVAVRVMVKFP